MTIALINVGNNTTPLTLMYSLSCHSCESEMGRSWLGNHKHKTVRDTDLAYTLRPSMKGRGESLWITGKTFEISGRIANQGATGALEGWSAGFIQTIHQSRRNARYEGHVDRLMRLDTGGGSLKDGDDDSIYYTGTEATFGLQDVLSIDLEDSPNFEMPLRHGPGNQRLLESSGCDVFASHLVLVRNKTIVELAKVQWNISWQGKVRWPDNGAIDEITWQPDQPDRYLSFAISENPALFADLDVNPIHTPFSLDLNEAEGYCEIFDNGEWRRCSFRGDMEKGQNPPHRSWR